jgi:DNA end-binding protein Ku
MARSIWSGFLSFGLVNVPVGLYPATADQTIHFNQLHKGTSHRIRYKKVDEVTGDEVATQDIVNGFPLGGGEYVVVTRDELKEAAPGKSETIEISDFVDLGEIDPVHFRQTYYLAPRGKGADRAYALLRQAMQETGKIGIATMVLRDKEHLVAVRPGDDVLILETMYFADEIRSPTEELETLPRDASFQGRELDVAKRLVESLTVPWAPGDYHNTYRARVEELIEHKREGQAVVFEAERPKSNVIDLMAALEASVANMGPGAAGGTGGTGGTGGSGTRAGGTGGSGTRAGGTRADGTRADGTRADGTRASGSGARESGSSRSSGRGGAAAGRGREPDTASGPAGLAALSKADLLARAAELDIAGRSKMSKPELIKAIQAAGRPKRGARKIS